MLAQRAPARQTHLRIGVDHELDILFIWFKSDDLDETLDHFWSLPEVLFVDLFPEFRLF